MKNQFCQSGGGEEPNLGALDGNGEKSSNLPNTTRQGGRARSHQIRETSLQHWAEPGCEFRQGKGDVSEVAGKLPQAIKDDALPTSPVGSI